jgi:hypothetical protein
MQYTRMTTTERASLLRALSVMGEYLHRRYASLSREEATRRGPNGEWSPVEQVWHLADLEREGFGVRMHRLRHESRPQLADFDGTRIANEREYRSLSLESGLITFAAARAANLATIRAVDDAEWDRGGLQEGVGTVTLCDVPLFMAQHDAAHMTEIEQWRVQRN